jgi:2-polyprenyl-6-methoxyphenol hydroxylase-like FAD-dependent oxidoreductase
MGAAAARSVTAPPLRIAVIGAGSTGLYLSRLLLSAGHRVSLFERAPQPRTDGCGILLVSSGVEAIAAAGDRPLLERLLQGGQPVRRFEVRNLRGDTISDSPAEQDSDRQPALLIERPVILAALLEGLPAERVHGNAELIGWQQGPEEVSAFFANGDIWSGDLLLAADGIFSRVAPRLVPEHRLHYLGDRVWRGVVADDHFCNDGAFFVYARGRGIYVNAFDLGPGPDGRSRTHWGFFHEEPLPTSREQQRQLLQEPIPAEALARLDPRAAALIAATPPEAVVANWSYDLDPLPRLVQGRVGLLGDAAHAMSSSQARGMTAGLEDALALAEALAACPDDPLAALLRYECERLPIVHAYQERSRSISSRIGRQGKRPTAQTM